MRRVDLRKYRYYVLAAVMLVFLHSLRYFDYINLDPTWYGRIGNLLAILLIFICLVSRGPRYVPGKWWMLALMAVPVMSFLPCWLENGQNPVESSRAYLVTGLVLVYYLLHNAQVRPKDLITGVTVFAVVRVLILIVQQLTYPDYLFAYRPEGLNVVGYYSGIEVRSGIYRFYIEDTYLSMFLVFYYIQRLLKRVEPLSVILFLVGIVGVYLDQSRQFMFSTAAAILLVIILSSRVNLKWLLLIPLGGLLVFVLLRSTSLFEDLILMTRDDLTSNNSRLLSYATFGLEFWGGPLSVIFGNGPVGNSNYGEMVTYMKDYMRVYHSDIGIVGAANLYGVVTVLTFIAFYVFYVAKHWKKMQSFLKMYFVALIINIPLVSIYTQNINWFVFFGFMVFLSDRSIIAYEKRKARYLLHVNAGS